jgi:hypothetical protein
MGTVLSMQRPRRAEITAVVPGLIDLFATRRRGRHDAFWLKENAELVQILAAIGARDVDLGPLRIRTDALMDELRFFPQYYRMYLSLAVDLRILGWADAPVEEMARFVQAADLAQIELSDSHRNEARLLLRRAGAEIDADTGLDARLQRFVRHSAAFCLPNRRAAYDLTHIVFHASDYGRATLAPDPDLTRSLVHAGLVAWLEDNLDLLAEVTLALRLSGAEVPQVWAQAVAAGAAAVSFEPGQPQGPFDDDYHQYLVLNWAQAVAGGQAFQGGVPASARLILQPVRQGHALHELSLALLDMGTARRADWETMRWRVWPKLSDSSRARLEAVEAMPEFAGFFAGFARAGSAKASPVRPYAREAV